MRSYRLWVVYGGGSFDYTDKELPDDEAAKAYALRMGADATKFPCALIVMNLDRTVWRHNLTEVPA